MRKYHNATHEIVSLPLNEAIKERVDVEEIRTLLENGADPNGMNTGYKQHEENDYKYGPIHYFSMGDVFHETNVCEDGKGITHSSIERRKRDQKWHDEVIDLLVEYGADPQMKCFECQYTVQMKCFECQVEPGMGCNKCRYTPPQRGRDRSSRFIKTPLQVAVKNSAYHATQSLLRYVEPDIETMYMIDMHTSGSEYGSLTGKIRCMKVFFDHRIDLKADVNGDTPLMRYVTNNREYAVVMVAHYSKLNPDLSDVNAQNADGNTALHLLAKSMGMSKKKDILMFEALVGAGADPLIQNANGETPSCIFFKRAIDHVKRGGMWKNVFGSEMKNWIDMLGMTPGCEYELERVTKMIKVKSSTFSMR